MAASATSRPATRISPVARPADTTQASANAPMPRDRLGRRYVTARATSNPHRKHSASRSAQTAATARSQSANAAGSCRSHSVCGAASLGGRISSETSSHVAHSRAARSQKRPSPTEPPDRSGTDDPGSRGVAEQVSFTFKFNLIDQEARGSAPVRPYLPHHYTPPGAVNF